MFAKQILTAARQLAPEVSATLSKLESPALIRLTEEVASLRQAGAHALREPKQLSLFPELPEAGNIFQSGTLVEQAAEPLRRVFVASETTKNLAFHKPMIGFLDAKEILPNGSLSGRKFVAFHHMDAAGKIQISQESAVNLGKSDMVITCHPETLAQHVSIGKQLLQKHVMPETTGQLTVRHSNLRVFDPESKRYGYLFDVVNEPFMKEAGRVTRRSGQMSLPFERHLNTRAPLPLVKRENPWLFVDDPAAIWSGS